MASTHSCHLFMKCLLLIKICFYFTVVPPLIFRLLRSLVLSLSQYSTRRLIPIRSRMNRKGSFREQLQTKMQRKPLQNNQRVELHVKESDDAAVFFSVAWCVENEDIKESSSEFYGHTEFESAHQEKCTLIFS